MKKIYTFTLDDEIPSEDTINDVKVIAYMLYESILSFSEEDMDISLANSFIRRNELYEINRDGKYIYRFESEGKKDDYRLLEPIIFNNMVFGITVDDKYINESDIDYLLKGELRLFNNRYKFKVNSYSYDDSKLSNRFILIDSIVGDKYIPPMTKTKKKIASFLI